MTQVLSCTVTLGVQRAVVHLGGELDSCTAADLFNALAPLVRSGPEVIVDLSGLSFVGTAGVVLLDRLAQGVAANGGSFTLTAPTPPVRRVLDITGLAERFTIRLDAAHPTA